MRGGGGGSATSRLIGYCVRISPKLITAARFSLWISVQCQSLAHVLKLKTKCPLVSRVAQTENKSFANTAAMEATVSVSVLQ